MSFYERQEFNSCMDVTLTTPRKTKLNCIEHSKEKVDEIFEFCKMEGILDDIKHLMLNNNCCFLWRKFVELLQITKLKYFDYSNMEDKKSE